MTDRQLQRLLEATAASTVYPETPALSRAVLARIGTARSAQRGLRLGGAPLVIALVLLLALAGALLLPPSRDAIARFFGVQGSSIERLPAGAALPPAKDLDALAAPITPSLAAALSPVRPSGAGEPLQAYVVMYREQPVVILHYERFDLWQTQLPMMATFSKQAPPNAELRDVKVGAHDGRWLVGEHTVYYAIGGQMVPGSQRTVMRNTLIWRTPRAFYRLETSSGLDEALQIARTLP